MTAGKLAVAFFAIGVLALIIGTLVPATIDAQDAEKRDTVLLEEGESEIYDDVIEIELLAVNNSGSNVNVSVRDTATQDNQNITNLSIGETKSVNLVGGAVEVTNEDIETGQSADLTPAFARTYGWEPGAKTFADNLDIMLSLLGILMVLGGLGQVMKQ